MKIHNSPDTEFRKNKLAELTERYPFLEATAIGKSMLGRDIDCFRLGEGKRSILTVGAHHGMEHITALALYNFVDFLAKKNELGASYCGVNIPYLLSKCSFFTVPCVNPDGVELQLHGATEGPMYSREIRMNGDSRDFTHWQANARGVDLNHNYAYGFAEYKRIETAEGILPGKTRFSGEHPESEPETAALAGLVRALAPAAVVSLHTQGEEIYSMPKTERVEKIAKRLALGLGYKSSVARGHAAYGGLSDFTGAVLGIPSFTVELGRGENPLPEKQLPAISERVRKLLISLPTYLNY